MSENEHLIKFENNLFQNLSIIYFWINFEIYFYWKIKRLLDILDQMRFLNIHTLKATNLKYPELQKYSNKKLKEIQFIKWPKPTIFDLWVIVRSKFK